MPVLQRYHRLGHPHAGQMPLGAGPQEQGARSKEQGCLRQGSGLFRPNRPSLSLAHVCAGSMRSASSCLGQGLARAVCGHTGEALTQLSVSKTPRRKQTSKQNPRVLRESSARVSHLLPPGLSCLPPFCVHPSFPALWSLLSLLGFFFASPA